VLVSTATGGVDRAVALQLAFSFWVTVTVTGPTAPGAFTKSPASVKVVGTVVDGLNTSKAIVPYPPSALL
jgi:hypothetical protein